MKIAHFVHFAPNQCGLYGTATDLIKAERLVGINAGLIDFDGEKHREGMKDGDIEALPLKWAENADILVRHSAIPAEYQTRGIPIVLSLHGRPESSVTLEKMGETPVITLLFNKSIDCRYKAFFTYWKEHLKFWTQIIPKEKMFYVPALVDLEKFHPVGEQLKLEGNPKILIADIWREDVTPFNVLQASLLFRETCPAAKIHLVGLEKKYLKPLLPLLGSKKNKGAFGTIKTMTRHIDKWYRSVDIIATPHVIATRIVREGLACGKKVVAGEGNEYTPFTANPMDIKAYALAIKRCYEDKDFKPREMAEKSFSFKKSGEAVKKIYDTILNQKPTKRKVFIDIGGHLGQTVRRFYKEVEDARFWEIYSFEPEKETFEKLKKNVGNIPNVTLINKAASITNENIPFYIGTANQNEGGTTLTGKTTGGVNYTKPVMVESVDFCDWLKDIVTEDDYVVVKINAEGGEYPIMGELIKRDLTGLIDQIYIQLHAHKFEHGKIRQAFQGIEALFWNNAKCEKFFLNKGFKRFQCE